MENYTQADLREAIGILLSYIDRTLPEGTHYRGQSPDWFVAAASMACNVPSQGERPCIDYVRELTQY